LSNTFFDFKLFKLNDLSAEAPQLQGQHKRGLLIFFEAPEAEAAELLDFLASILKAIKLDLHQDTIFINRKPEENFKVIELLEKNNTRQVLIFGIPPTSLGIQFALPAYLNISHRNVSYLWADSLSSIFAERQAGGKKMSGKLWKAIQEFEL